MFFFLNIFFGLMTQKIWWLIVILQTALMSLGLWQNCIRLSYRWKYRSCIPVCLQAAVHSCSSSLNLMMNSIFLCWCPLKHYWLPYLVNWCPNYCIIPTKSVKHQYYYYFKGSVYIFAETLLYKGFSPL